jgi:phosphoribosylaminoimidazole carboxylase (NCAIR synthetase)
LRLLIIGAGQLSQFLAQIASALDYQSPSATRVKNTGLLVIAGRIGIACHAR